MKNKSLLLFILLIVIGIGAFALYRWQYKRTTKEAEKRLLQIIESQANCHAPCWQGLIPGQSGLDEYQQFTKWLDERGFVFRSENNADDFIIYSWVYPESDLFLYIDLGNKINNIEFSLNDLARIENLFDILGEPDYYTADFIYDIESVVVSTFLYPEKGIVVTLRGLNPDQVTDDCYLQIKPTQKSYLLSLVPIGEPMSMLEASYNAYHLADNSIKSWNGMESIEVNQCRKQQQ